MQSNLRSRIHRLKTQITDMEHVCSGSLIQRMKRCGKSSCRCASDPKSLHGPYFEWSRLEKGRMVHRTISPEQAKVIKKAITNRRAILKILLRWEQETLREAGVNSITSR